MVYDLYGVVYHGGSLNFGHYTAKCFNEATGRWHSYNDSTVTDVDPNILKSSIVNPGAYVLFYKRRGFQANTVLDFENIKCQPSGVLDHLLMKSKGTGLKQESEQIAIKTTDAL